MRKFRFKKRIAGGFLALLASLGLISQVPEKTVELNWVTPTERVDNTEIGEVHGYEIDCAGQAFSVGNVTTFSFQSSAWGSHVCSIVVLALNENGDILRSVPTLSNTISIQLPWAAPKAATGFTAEVK